MDINKTFLNLYLVSFGPHSTVQNYINLIIYYSATFMFLCNLILTSFYDHIDVRKTSKVKSQFKISAKVTSKWRLQTTSFWLWNNPDVRMMLLLQSQNDVKCKRHFDVDVWYFFEAIFKFWFQFEIILTSFWHQCDDKLKSFW